MELAEFFLFLSINRRCRRVSPGPAHAHRLLSVGSTEIYENYFNQGDSMFLIRYTNNCWLINCSVGLRMTACIALIMNDHIFCSLRCDGKTTKQNTYLEW